MSCIDFTRSIRCDTSRGSIMFEIAPTGDKYVRVHEYDLGLLELDVHRFDHASNTMAIAAILAVSHHPNARNV